MNYIGISYGFHDAGVSVIDNHGEILFAGHSERYSKIKHDKFLSKDLFENAISYTTSSSYEFHYYENSFLKLLRQIRSGESTSFFKKPDFLKKYSVKSHSHHLSHAAAGFQTSSFSNATIIIVDAIGEFDTISIWYAYYDNTGSARYKKLYNKKYPNSIGLFYSAATAAAGLHPLDEEYILMGMAAYGKPLYYNKFLSLIKDDFFFTNNLHIGFPFDTSSMKAEDIAASAQAVLETLLERVLHKAKSLSKSNNLVYGGGVALNCLANSKLGNFYNNIWIMPNPGDCGSSLGAAALGYKKQVNWKTPYLGYNISEPYPVDSLLQELLTNKIVGVANGRAEFGPRALGNRSLLADPRGDAIKQKVNEIKQRQQFRPFAPVILEEYAKNYFLFPKSWEHSRYMQVIAYCKTPGLYPAIVHYDNTSRVQTVPKNESGIRKLLEAWYSSTGCPMLLNTSLNIRGMPMVNDKIDAENFEKLYNVKVF